MLRPGPGPSGAVFPRTDGSSSQPVKKKQRARMIEFFIDVAQECFNIGNFNSLMAIISECGLQTSVDLWPQFRCV